MIDEGGLGPQLYRDASLEHLGERVSIALQRRINCDLQELWRALTVPSVLRQWFPTEVIVAQWVIGADLTFTFPAGQAPDFAGRVLDIHAPTLLVFSWGDEVLRFSLEASSARYSTLHLIDELAAPYAARNAAGWDICLDTLAAIPGDRVSWSERYAHYVAVFEPIVGPQEGPPPGF